MKKTLVALAALAATGAFAQVTISGSMNVGYKNSAAGAGSVGALKGDRNHLTFTAAEDIGNGLKVTAALQLRYDSMHGGNTYGNTAIEGGTKGANLFEQSRLTVEGGFGTVSVGRFTNAIGVAPLHFMEDSAYSGASTSAYGRLSGQLQYLSPSFAGAQVWALTARMDQNTYPTASGNGMTASSVAANGVITSGTAALRNFSAFGLNYANGPIYAQVSSITGLYDDTNTKWGVTYNLGMAKLAVGQYRQGKDVGTHATAANNMAAHTTTEYGVEVPFGQFVGAVTMHRNDKDLDSTKTDGTSQQQKVGYKLYYSLNKTTTLEFEGSNTSNAGAGASSNGTAYYLGARKTF